MFHIEKKGKKRKLMQDNYSTYVNDHFSIYVLSDGVTGKLYTTTGITKIIENLIYIFERSFIGDFSINSLRFEVSSVINETIHVLAKEKHCSKDEFACTLMFVLLPSALDYYFIVHIGDGMIGRTKENIIEILSYPDTGVYINQTYTTSSPNIYNHIHVKKINKLLGQSNVLLMMTDGLFELIYDRVNHRLLNEFETAICKKEWEEIKGIIDSVDNDDDCSLCVFSCN